MLPDRRGWIWVTAIDAEWNGLTPGELLAVARSGLTAVAHVAPYLQEPIRVQIPTVLAEVRELVAAARAAEKLLVAYAASASPGERGAYDAWAGRG